MLEINVSNTEINLSLSCVFFYWYHLLKLVQKYGTIEKFDLLFHRSGPSAGQPRGYAFVTYSSTVDATKAKDALDGMLFGCKRVVVRWANSVSKVCVVLSEIQGFASNSKNTKLVLSEVISHQVSQKKMGLHTTLSKLYFIFASCYFDNVHFLLHLIIM